MPINAPWAWETENEQRERSAKQFAFQQNQQLEARQSTLAAREFGVLQATQIEARRQKLASEQAAIKFAETQNVALEERKQTVEHEEEAQLAASVNVPYGDIYAGYDPTTTQSTVRTLSGDVADRAEAERDAPGANDVSGLNRLIAGRYGNAPPPTSDPGSPSTQSREELTQELMARGREQGLTSAGLLNFVEDGLREQGEEVSLPKRGTPALVGGVLEGLDWYQKTIGDPAAGALTYASEGDMWTPEGQRIPLIANLGGYIKSIVEGKHELAQPTGKEGWAEVQDRFWNTAEAWRESPEPFPGYKFAIEVLAAPDTYLTLGPLKSVGRGLGKGGSRILNWADDTPIASGAAKAVDAVAGSVSNQYRFRRVGAEAFFEESQRIKRMPGIIVSNEAREMERVLGKAGRGGFVGDVSGQRGLTPQQEIDVFDVNSMALEDLALERPELFTSQALDIPDEARRLSFDDLRDSTISDVSKWWNEARRPEVEKVKLELGMDEPHLIDNYIHRYFTQHLEGAGVEKGRSGKISAMFRRNPEASDEGLVRNFSYAAVRDAAEAKYALEYQRFDQHVMKEWGIRAGDARLGEVKTDVPRPRESRPPQPLDPDTERIMRESGMTDQRSEQFLGTLRRGMEDIKRSVEKPLPDDVVEQALQPSKTMRVGEVPPVQIEASKFNVDPERFQFKLETNPKTGASSKFADVETWNPLPGSDPVHAWQDKSGKLFVVNGHHRVELAGRVKGVTDPVTGQVSGVPSEGVKLNTIIYREADGISAEQARALGAIANIGQGQGTSVDVAKFLRDSGLGLDDLKVRHGLAVRSGIAERGLALASLTGQIFNRVMTKQLTEDRAVVIGRELAGDLSAHQKDVAEWASKGTGKSPEELHAYVQEAKRASTVSETQGSMFGESKLEKSTLEERARIRSRLKSKMLQTRRLMNTVTRHKGAIEVGETNIDVAASSALGEEAAKGSYLFDTFANAKGPVSDLIGRTVNRIMQGGDDAKQLRRLRAEALEDAERELPEAIESQVRFDQPAVAPQVSDAPPAGSPSFFPDAPAPSTPAITSEVLDEFAAPASKAERQGEAILKSLPEEQQQVILKREAEEASEFDKAMAEMQRTMAEMEEALASRQKTATVEAGQGEFDELGGALDPTTPGAGKVAGTIEEGAPRQARFGIPDRVPSGYLPYVSKRQLPFSKTSTDEKIYLPAEIVKAMTFMHDPGSQLALIRAFDAVHAIAKVTVTQAFPAYHLRNMLSDYYRSVMDGVWNPVYYLKSAQVMKAFRNPAADGLPKTININALETPIKRVGEDVAARQTDEGLEVTVDEFITLMNEHGVINTGFFGKSGDFREGLNRHFLSAEAGADEIIGAGMQGGGKLSRAIGLAATPGEHIENWGRISHLLGRLDKGDDFLTAAAHVRKYKVDYSDLTPFEKALGRRTFFFYTYMRKSLGLEIENMIKGRKIGPIPIGPPIRNIERVLSSVQGAVNPDDDEVRDELALSERWLFEQLNIVLGKNDKGNPLVLYGSGLPLEYLNMFFSGDGLRTVNKWISAMNPLLKAPLEVATDRSSFTGRTITDQSYQNWYRRAWDGLAEVPGLRDWLELEKVETANGETYYEADPIKNYLFMTLLSGVSRFAQTVNKATNEDIPLGARALQIATGAKVAEIDVQRRQTAGRGRLHTQAYKGFAENFERLAIQHKVGERASGEELTGEQMYKQYLELKDSLGSELAIADKDLENSGENRYLVEDARERQAIRRSLLSGEDRKLAEYEDLNPDEFRLSTGTIDWKAYWAQRDELRAALTPEQAKTVEDRKAAFADRLGPEGRVLWRKIQRALKVSREIADLPDYIIPGTGEVIEPELEAEINEARSKIADFARNEGPGSQVRARRFYIQLGETPEDREYRRETVGLVKRSIRWRNPQVKALRFENAELLKSVFSDLTLEEVEAFYEQESLQAAS